MPLSGRVWQVVKTGSIPPRAILGQARYQVSWTDGASCAPASVCQVPRNFLSPAHVLSRCSMLRRSGRISDTKLTTRIL